MIDDQINDALIAEITVATRAVLGMMVSLQAQAGAPKTDSPGPGPLGGVSAMVGMAGDWVGAGAVSCNENVARTLASRMLDCDCPSVNDDVLDAIGEIANMVIGNIKSGLESTTGPLILGMPTVTYGLNFATRCTVKEAWTLVPFALDGEELLVQVLLTEGSRLHQASRATLHRVLACSSPV